MTLPQPQPLPRSSRRHQRELRIASALMVALVAQLGIASPGNGRQAAREVPRVEVNADRLEAAPRQKKATYSGHARATRGNLSMWADSIDVSYSPGGDIQHLIAQGHVRLEQQNNAAIGDLGEYSAATGDFVLTGQPTLTSKQTFVRGERVVFHTKTEAIEVVPASTLVRPSDERRPPLSIEAKRLLWESPLHRATWTGDVVAVRGAARLSTPRLTAQLDTAGDIQTAVASSGVEVSDATRWAKGQRAVYHSERQTVTVTGSPRARDGMNELLGQRVVLYLHSERMEVDQAMTVVRSRNSAISP